MEPQPLDPRLGAPAVLGHIVVANAHGADGRHDARRPVAEPVDEAVHGVAGS